jgi:hypothetical protein
MTTPEERLKELGINLPVIASPGATASQAQRRSPSGTSAARLGIAPAQLFQQRDHLGIGLGVGLAPFAFSVPCALSIPSGLELGDRRCLLELGDGA